MNLARVTTSAQRPRLPAVTPVREAPLSQIQEAVVEDIAEEAEELVDELFGGLKDLLGKDD